MWLFIAFVSTAQNDKTHVEKLTADFTKSLQDRGIHKYFYLNKYCLGRTEMFTLKDGSMCISKGTYYEVYIFWKEDQQTMVKKIDNCGMYFSLALEDDSIFNFFGENAEAIKNEVVQPYAVANPENVPAQSSKIHPCHRLFQFHKKSKSYGQEYNLYDLTNESKYENINFESNNALKIVSLEKIISETLIVMEPKFRRQF